MKPAHEEFCSEIEELTNDNQIFLDCIFNYDETSIFWDMPPKKVYLPRGEKNYKVKTNNNDKKRITVGLLTSANGEKYEP